MNVVSAWLLSGGDHHHGHSHGHGTADSGHGHEEEAHSVMTSAGLVVLSVFEDGVPPRFRLHAETGPVPAARPVRNETVRPGGACQWFTLADRGGYLESVEEIPEPHAFTAQRHLGESESHAVVFEEPEGAHAHAHGAAHRDNNMRAAVVHVIAAAAASVLVIVGLLLARAFGWLWMDPLAGIVGGMRHCELVLRADPRHRRDPARHESGPPPGRQAAANHRARRRRAGRPVPLAPGPRPSGGDRVGAHRAGAAPTTTAHGWRRFLRSRT